MDKFEKLKLRKTWVPESPTLANIGHYEWTIETSKGWMHLSKEQNEALVKLEKGATGNPLLND